MKLPISEFWRGMIGLCSWVIASVWGWRTYDAVQSLPTVPNLTEVDWNLRPERQPSLVVVVPARDEAENIAATIDALLLADYEPMLVLAVDDRSTDGTGRILDQLVSEYAKRQPGRLGAIHIEDLPDGWLGKTFALTVATENSDSEYLLFTDADVLFSPSILRRALVYAEQSQADHLVVMPTAQVKSRGEGIVLGFLQVIGLWGSRPWRVHRPEARHDVVGVGAFNLVRREALRKIGGWAPQRLSVLEDVTLGRRFKAAGMRQRVAFAPGLVLVHWAKGARGLIRVMTKNLFSAVNFRPLFLLLAALWIVVFCLAPVAGVAWWTTLVPSLIVLCCIGAMYRLMGAFSGIDSRYGLLYPLGALAFLYTMLRSMVLAWVQRGVVWRGTHYELRDLRRHNNPFQWKRAARQTRNQKMQEDLTARSKQTPNDEAATRTAAAESRRTGA